MYSSTSSASPNPPPRLIDLLLAQASEHALIVLDLEGRIVDWCGGAERIFHYRAAEMIGQKLDCLFTPEDRALGMPAYELRLAASAGHAEDDRWHCRRDGSRFWASGAVTALRDAQGTLQGFGKILRDRIDLKSQLRALANRVEESRRADARKNIFLGKLAHELRNPLGTLTNVAALLLHKTATLPELAELGRLAQRQVAVLARLADDLNDATRIAAGKVELRIEPVALGQAVADAVESCRRLVEDHAHNLEVLMPQSPIVVECDRTRLQQILTNLLANAAKYTPRGGRIWVKGTTEGDEAVIRVEDTGVGIPPDMIAHVFELFTQVASSRERAEGGLGLGLPLVKELVSLHGGTVQLLSEGENRGSEFTVRLPLRQRR